MDEEIYTITLYKYLSVVGLEKFIKEKTIKLSFGYETNDRFEVLSGDLVPKCRSEEQEDDFAAGTHIGFISLSEVEENPYMWGYYAEQYRGARLKFQFKVKKEIEDGAERYLRVDAVAPRQKDYFSIQSARFDGEYIERCEYEANRQDKINTALPKCTKNIISNKHISWEGEREYRILYSINNVANNDLSPLLKRTENGMYVTADLNRWAVALECGPFSKFSISEIKREFVKDSLLRGIAVRRLSFVPGLYRTECKINRMVENELDLRSNKEQIGIDKLIMKEIHPVPECGWSSFMTAARRGAYKELASLYRDEQQLNKLDCANCNALALATLSRSEECVKWLLEKGASIKDCDLVTKNKALIWAASVGLEYYVKHLLDHGAEVNCCADDAQCGSVRKRTALHYAARNGHHQCVSVLVNYIKSSSDELTALNMKDEEGRTPLMLAAWSKSLPSVKCLVDAGAQVNETDNENSSALIMAAWGNGDGDENDAKIIELLLAHEAKPDIFELNGHTAMFYAAIHGRPVCLNLLMNSSKSWSDNKQTYQTLLKYAVRGGNVQCAELIVEKLHVIFNGQHLPSLFEDSRHQIEVAAYVDNADKPEAEAMINFLKENGLIGELSDRIIEHLKRKPDALMKIAKSGRKQILEEIIDLDKDNELRNVCDAGKCTALMWSVYSDSSDNQECVNLLCAHYGKKNIMLKDWGGCNVIMWAARKGSTACLKTLLEQFNEEELIDLLSMPDSNGMTALMWAAWKGKKNCLAEMLPNKDAELLLDATDCEGYTALDWAIKGKDKSCIKFLLENDARYGSETRTSSLHLCTMDAT